MTELATIKIAACPHCGGACAADMDRFHGSIVRWQIHCDTPPAGTCLPNCGYKGPFCNDLADAARKHNKISQNAGAV